MIGSQQQKAFGRDQDLPRIIVMNEKYQWTLGGVSHGRFKLIEKGSKPKHLAQRLSGN